MEYLAGAAGYVEIEELVLKLTGRFFKKKLRLNEIQ